jgi:hypothetical protein
MDHHLFNLLKQSFYGMPGLISSNWLAWTLGFFVFLVYELFTLLLRGWQDMKQRWKQNVAIGTAAAIAGYIVLFAISVTRTVYDDHQSLVAKITELQGRKADSRNEIAMLTTEGGAIRDEWQAFLRENSNKHLDQSLYANRANEWHGKVIDHLASIPNGTAYITRFNTAEGPQCGGWPLGIDYKYCDDLAKLLGRIATLREFLKEPGI